MVTYRSMKPSIFRKFTVGASKFQSCIVGLNKLSVEKKKNKQKSNKIKRIGEIARNIRLERSQFSSLTLSATAG